MFAGECVDRRRTPSLTANTPPVTFKFASRAIVMAENVFEDFEASARVDRSAVRILNAHSATLERSAVQRLSSEAVNAQNSAMGLVHTSNLEMHESAAGAVFGDYVKAENSSVVLLIAPRVSGNVKAVITLPVAFAFGFGYFFARRLAGMAIGKRR
jgi:hypothetical protein